MSPTGKDARFSERDAAFIPRIAGDIGEDVTLAAARRKFTPAKARIDGMRQALQENAWQTDAGHAFFTTHGKRKRRREKRWLKKRLR